MKRDLILILSVALAFTIIATHRLSAHLARREMLNALNIVVFKTGDPLNENIDMRAQVWSEELARNGIKVEWDEKEREFK